MGLALKLLPQEQHFRQKSTFIFQKMKWVALKLLQEQHFQLESTFIFQKRNGLLFFLQSISLKPQINHSSSIFLQNHTSFSYLEPSKKTTFLTFSNPTPSLSRTLTVAKNNGMCCLQARGRRSGIYLQREKKVLEVSCGEKIPSRRCTLQVLSSPLCSSSSHKTF